jgi:hypothetical protein
MASKIAARGKPARRRPGAPSRSRKLPQNWMEKEYERSARRIVALARKGNVAAAQIVLEDLGMLPKSAGPCALPLETPADVRAAIQIATYAVLSARFTSAEGAGLPMTTTDNIH